MGTFRRYHLDRLLSNTPFNGCVLDIGGKKENRRGRFCPPIDKITSWKYVNIDVKSNPDYVCSADKLPMLDETFDVVLMTEVLEHLEKPDAALSEASRVLKKGGCLVCTMPFLYPIHADPYDFQRWTPAKIELELKKAGLTVIQLEHMGGVFAVVYDLFHAALRDASKNSKAFKNKVANKCFMPVIAKIFIWLDKYYIYKSKTITTGFYVVAVRQE
jgi:ubiquinone/menaquinone biosynthesis C-methylase UbiE